ncbi:DnaD domain protein [Calorimonas adulescens]|jgi:DnaD and phage-associated domain|nr:DnaD domain protein [Calorimonas adulescens]
MLEFCFDDSGIGSTPISNSFITRYLADSPGDYIKVYILGLYLLYQGIKTDPSDMAKMLNMDTESLKMALDYWASQGLIQYKSNGGNISSIIYVSPESINYTPKDENVYAESELEAMFSYIENQLGRPLSPREMETFLEWLDKYHFSMEVLVLLVEYCLQKKKVNINYMARVAQGWFDAGIRNGFDVEKHLKNEEKRWNIYKKVYQTLGLNSEEIAEAHKNMINRWLDELNVSDDDILEACNICIMNINKPNFNYINKVLTNKNQNISSKPKKTTGYVAPKHYFNSYNQRSYDIKELEKRLLERSSSGE